MIQTLNILLTKNRSLEESEEIEEEKTKNQVAHDAVLPHIESLIQYLDEQDDASLYDKIVLEKFKTQVKKWDFTTKKQITDRCFV